jgi:Tfp pilus assembly protein PilW
MLTRSNIRMIRRGGMRRQAGFTLMEAMIALGLSMIVTSAMVVLMANSLGTATKVIQMTQLTDELRNAMSMMSRDVRRANYSASAVYCYANSDCGIDGSATQAPDITIGGDCFTFNLDRNQDGDASTDDAGAFRRVTAGGVGLIEMWVGDSAPNCGAASTDWVAVTDPGFIDVTTFAIDDSASFTGTLVEEGGTILTQRTRQVQIALEGRLIRDNRITRRIEDVIKVRNDIFL